MKRALVIVIMLVSAACGGGDDDGAETGALTKPSMAPRTTAKASVAPAVTDVDAGTAQGKESSTPAPEGEEPAPNDEAEPTAATPTRPKVGSYSFHEEGTRRAGSTGQDQPYENDGTLVVSESGARSTLRFETEQGSEEMTLRFEKDRVLLERARIEQSIATFDARFEPPQMVIRTPIKVGDSWTNSWKAGGTSGTTKIKVVREEAVRALGKLWRAYVIENATTASGDAKGTTTSSSWYVAELGLDVKRVSDFEGSYQGVPFKQHAERVITKRP